MPLENIYGAEQNAIRHADRSVDNITGATMFMGAKLIFL